MSILLVFDSPTFEPLIPKRPVLATRALPRAGTEDADYILPSSARMMMITSSKPTNPPGAYPQELLYPHVGSTPINASTNRIIKIVPRLICFLSCFDDFLETNSASVKPR